jgi:hypothetical protein
MARGTTATLIQQVQSAFQFGRPNGLELNWNPNRFFSGLTRLCTDCQVANSTDFNYSYCNSFDIEPAEREGHCRYVMTAKFSFVAPAYSVHVTKYSWDKKRGSVVPETENEEMLRLTKLVRQFAAQNGFQEVDGTDHEIVLDGITLELSEVATLGKCLFDDFE